MISSEITVVIETILVNGSRGVENRKSEGGSGMRKGNGDGGSYDEDNDNTVKASKTKQEQPKAFWLSLDHVN